MRKLWKFCKYFSSAEKCWRWPRESDVLIYDACGQDILLEYLEPWKPEVLHVRGEQINVRVLFASLFRSGKRYRAYIDCYIERVHPRLIVTFIDNDVNFLAIRQRHPKVKTMFIQNGWKNYPADVFEALDNLDAKHRQTLAVDIMLSFGPISGAEFSRYISGTVVSMGSIKNNRVPHTQLRQPDTIAFVSQWRTNGLRVGGIFRTQEEFFVQPDRLILQSLKQYANERGKRLVIIVANRKDAELRLQEEVYFRDLLEQEAECLDPEGVYPSYQAVDAAEVVVTVDSTLGYESIARGNRTAIFSIRSRLLGAPGLTYGWPADFPVEGPFWTNNPDADAFVRILDHLFAIDDMQWRREIESTDFSSLLIYDPGNSILKSILTSQLGTQIPSHH